MGPRLCGRGDVVRWAFLAYVAKSFNGAAPLWARRSPSFFAGNDRPMSFNGAAPLWARR